MASTPLLLLLLFCSSSPCSVSIDVVDVVDDVDEVDSPPVPCDKLLLLL